MKLHRTLLSITLLLSLLLLYGCSGTNKRGALDISDVPVLEVDSNEGLAENKSFTRESSKTMHDFVFDKASDVQSFKYRAYHNGTYKLTSYPAGALSFYTHTGNVVTDFWENTPSTEELERGREYIVEVKLTDAKYVGQEVTLVVETPNTAVKDISNCASFTDETYEKGELLYYTFTAPSTGEYTFTIENNSKVEMYKNGEQFDSTGWDTWSLELKQDTTVEFKVEMDTRYVSDTVRGSVEHPTREIDITELMKEKGCLAIKCITYSESQELIFTLKYTSRNSVTVSGADVGIQMSGGELIPADGYTAVDFKSGSNNAWRKDENVYAIQKDKTIKVTVKKSDVTRDGYITFFYSAADKSYLPFS